MIIIFQEFKVLKNFRFIFNFIYFLQRSNNFRTPFKNDKIDTINKNSIQRRFSFQKTKLNFKKHNFYLKLLSDKRTYLGYSYAKISNRIFLFCELLLSYYKESKKKCFNMYFQRIVGTERDLATTIGSKPRGVDALSTRARKPTISVRKQSVKSSISRQEFRRQKFRRTEFR